MKRIGDTFSFQGTEFDILAGDRTVLGANNGTAHASHYDWEGLLEEAHLQDAPDVNSGGINPTFSRYYNYEGIRGNIDLNFAHADGSVRRVTNASMYDPRLVQIPEFSAHTNLNGPLTALPPFPVE
jgi:hypothetical protein